MQQINVRAVGPGEERSGHRKHRASRRKNGTPLRVKDIAVVAQGPKIRLGQYRQARFIGQDGKILDNDDVVAGIVLLRKGADGDSTLEAIHEKVKELNDARFCRRASRSFRSSIAATWCIFTTHTVLHNLTEGIILVVDHSVSVSGQCSRRAHRLADHSVLAAVRGDLSEAEGHPCESAVAGRAGFRHGGGRRRGDGGKHRASPGPPHGSRQAASRASRFARRRMKSSGRFFTPSASSSPPTSRSSRCNASKAACSSRWRGPSPSRCWAR